MTDIQSIFGALSLVLVLVLWACEAPRTDPVEREETCCAGEDGAESADTRSFDTIPGDMSTVDSAVPDTVPSDTSGADTRVADAPAADSVSPDSSMSSFDSTDAGPERIRLPMVDATKQLQQRVTVDGSGSDAVGAVDIDDSFGTVAIDGQRIATLVYQKTAWQDFDRILYHAIGVAADELYVLWFYCGKDDTFREVWRGGTHGLPLEWEAASGSCSSVDEAHSIEVRFPAVDWAIPETVDTFEVSGDRIAIGSQAEDRVRFGGVDYRAFPFQEVDCTSDCGRQSWWELHTLLWDRSEPELLFGIFYLYPNGDPIQLSYLVELPGLVEPSQEIFRNATWSRK